MPARKRSPTGRLGSNGLECSLLLAKQTTRWEDMTLMYKTRTATPRLRPGPGGLPRGQVTQIQRSRMLAAAVEAVEDVGYARMTVAQVISRARVSRKTFYDVFADREDCFLAAFEQALTQARLIAQEAYERESSWRDGVRAALARLLLFMDEEPGLAKLCIVEALGAGRGSWTGARRCSTNWQR